MPKKKLSTKEIEQKIGELTEALQRERADAMNIRRRNEEHLARVRELVKADIVRQLLPVVDNLQRALAHTPKDLKDHNYVKGVQGVVKQFEKTLTDLGVEKIKTVGEPFDPHLHEAVSTEGEGNSLSSEEIISKELLPGYILGDEVLRHAMVKVKSK